MTIVLDLQSFGIGIVFGIGAVITFVAVLGASMR